MPTFVLTINLPTPPDRPGITVAQIMREVAPIVETSAPIAASGTHRERSIVGGATRATWTWS